MLKTILVPITVTILSLFSNGSDGSAPRLKINNNAENSVATHKVNSTSKESVTRAKQSGPINETGTLEKMLVAEGSAIMQIDLNRLNGIDSTAAMNALHFNVAPNSFFTILVFNKQLRGPEPGSMALIPQDSAMLPAELNSSFNQLVIEKIGYTEPFDIVVRDGKTGFTFFNIEGHLYDYDAMSHSLSLQDGRLLISEEFAAKLGRTSDAGAVIGNISVQQLCVPLRSQL